MKKNIVGIIKRKKVIVAILAGVILVAFFFIKSRQQSSSTQLQTAKVTRGTLVSTLTQSGTVALANRMSVTTGASGVVSEIDVKNGDVVTSGQKIAVITLDAEGTQRQAQAYASYLQAKSTLDSANANLYSLQATMFTDWNTYFNLATASIYQNGDGSPNLTNRILPPFTTAQDNWLAAEAAYKNQQGVIAQAQAALTSSYATYKADSSVVTAPSAGTVGDITITPGMQIVSTTNTSSTTSTTSNASSNGTGQFVASVKTQGNPVISVQLSEVDAAKIKAGQKATITFDALPNQTFTGQVLGINTTGVVSSGVTTYPASILLDLPNDAILPNMSANANVITHVDNNVLLVPSAAVQTVGGQSLVRVLRNNAPTPVAVEIGNSSDSQTEITSGLSEGDTVVTGTIAQTTGSTSPFSGNIRFGGFGGGGIRGGGGRGG